MHAMSFLGTVRHVESQLAVLGSRRRLDDERQIRECIWRAYDGVTDLTQLVVVTFPLPALSEPRSAADDRTVRSVLQQAHECDDGPDREEIDQKLVESGRVRIVAGDVLVPLANGGPAAANWYVLYPRLGDRLDSMSETCGRIARRLDTEGWPEWADALWGLQTVAADLRSVVGHAVAVTEWIAPPDGGIDDETRDARRIAARLVRKLSNEL